jgi:alpha-mannosidase/mannosylglycerate hydrolase
MKAYYICGTHWDREWYEPFQEYRLWLVQNLDDIMDRLDADPRYRLFHLDGQAVALEDYLEIRPERREQLVRLLKTGRLVAGPWYVMPDLWLVSGEALIRNLALGMETVGALGASSAKVGYCPDLFGHIAAMPTIFAGMGLDAAVVWRGLNDEQTKAQFFWVGPDGSRLLTHRLPDNAGYPWFANALRWEWTNRNQAAVRNTTEQSPIIPVAAAPRPRAQADAGARDAAEEFLKATAPRVLATEAARCPAPVLYLSDGSDHQTMPARIPELLDQLRRACPDIEFIHGSMDEYFAEVRRHAAELPEFRGELRSVARRTGMPWHALIPHCLSSRVPLKQANDRCQNLLTLWAEPMAAYAHLAGRPVPPGFLASAWKWLLLNQPHDSIGGCSIDATHADMPFRFQQAEGLGDGVRRQAMARLSAPSENLAPDGSHVVVWNPLPWPRREVCELELLFPPDYPAKAMRTGHNFPILNQFDLVGAAGQLLPYQVLDAQSNRTVKIANEQGRRRALAGKVDVYRVAVAMDLPAGGFAAVTIRPLEGVGRLKRQLGTLRTAPLAAANEHLRLTVHPNGLVDLACVKTGKTYRDLFHYEDSGDRGDGWNYVPPIRNPVVVSPGHAVQTGVVEDGPLQVTFRIERILRVPAGLDGQEPDRRDARLVELPVTDFLTLRAGDPLLRVRTVVENVACDHRLRVLLPTDIAADSYWSDQPFAWVERPVATDPGSAEYKEPDPPERPHHTIVALTDGQDGLAILCPEGLHEHSVLDEQRRTLALTLFRSVGKTPTTDGEPGPQVQGRLEFRYALCPFAGALPRGTLLRQVHGLQSLVGQHLTASAPANHGFLQMEAPDAVVPTAIKPAADGNGIIVRLWNTGDAAADVTVCARAASGTACLCDLNERPLGALECKDGAVRTVVAPRSLATIRLPTGMRGVRMRGVRP